MQRTSLAHAKSKIQALHPDVSSSSIQRRASFRQYRVDVPVPLLRELQHLPPLVRQLRAAALVGHLREEDGLPLLAGLLALSRLLALLLLQLLLQLRRPGELLGVDRARHGAPERQALVRELLVLRGQCLGRYGQGRDVY